MGIVEVKFKCNNCGKEITYKDIDIVESSYRQYVIDINDQEEKNYEGLCECEYGG